MYRVCHPASSPRLPGRIFALKSHNRRHTKAFSLVEVVLALGVFSFGMVSMVALLPSGLVAYQQASSSTAAAQITQSVTSEVQLLGFANIPAPASVAATTTTNYYFNAEGMPLTADTTPTLAAADPNVLYTANVTFSYVGNWSSSLLTSVNTNAYNVAVAITNKTQPTQVNHFSTIVAY